MTVYCLAEVYQQRGVMRCHHRLIPTHPWIDRQLEVTLMFHKNIKVTKEDFASTNQS